MDSLLGQEHLWRASFQVALYKFAITITTVAEKLSIQRNENATDLNFVIEHFM